MNVFMFILKILLEDRENWNGGGFLKIWVLDNYLINMFCGLKFILKLEERNENLTNYS